MLSLCNQGGNCLRRWSVKQLSSELRKWPLDSVSIHSTNAVCQTSIASLQSGIREEQQQGITGIQNGTTWIVLVTSILFILFPDTAKWLCGFCPFFPCSSPLGMERSWLHCWSPFSLKPGKSGCKGTGVGSGGTEVVMCYKVAVQLCSSSSSGELISMEESRSASVSTSCLLWGSHRSVSEPNFFGADSIHLFWGNSCLNNHSHIVLQLGLFEDVPQSHCLSHVSILLAPAYLGKNPNLTENARSNKIPKEMTK